MRTKLDELDILLAGDAEPLTLMPGESIRQYLDALDRACYAYARGMWGEVHVSVCDARASIAVVSVWRYDDGMNLDAYAALDYSRGEDGAFSINGWREVQRSTVYQPLPANAKPQLPPPGPEDPDDSMEGAFISSEAVEAPTADQRRNLPAAAFAAPFMADADGNYVTSGGTFQRSKSKLPHHTNTVTDPESDTYVDVPRLRNALARFSQTDWSDFGDAASDVEQAAREHLDMHAERLLNQPAEAIMAAHRATLLGRRVDEATEIAGVRLRVGDAASVNAACDRLAECADRRVKAALQAAADATALRSR